MSEIVRENRLEKNEDLERFKQDFLSVLMGLGIEIKQESKFPFVNFNFPLNRIQIFNDAVDYLYKLKGIQERSKYDGYLEL